MKVSCACFEGVFSNVSSVDSVLYFHNLLKRSQETSLHLGDKKKI